jgi:hypothetical protein
MATSRFKTASEGEINEILEGIDSKGTQIVIKKSANTFRKFLTENGLSPDFEQLQNAELNDRLRSFFASIKKQGKADEQPGMYKKNAFISLRYGLAKHIRKEMAVDIIDDPAFSSSRDVYLAMCTIDVQW